MRSAPQNSQPEFLPIARRLCQDPIFLAEVLAFLRAASELVTRLQTALAEGQPGGSPPVPEASPPVPEASPLTPRQTRILQEVSAGFTNVQIGEHCGISDATVKNHLTTILSKLHARDRAHAVAIAIRYGWIPLPAEAPGPGPAPGSPDAVPLAPSTDRRDGGPEDGGAGNGRGRRSRRDRRAAASTNGVSSSVS